MPYGVACEKFALLRIFITGRGVMVAQQILTLQECCRGFSAMFSIIREKPNFDTQS